MKWKPVILHPSAYAGLVILLLGLIIFFSDKGQIAGDGVPRWEALTALMSEHRLTADKYSIVQPLLAVPLFLIGETWERADSLFSDEEKALPSETRAFERNKIIVQRFNKFIIWGIAIWWYGMLQQWYALTPKQAAWATLFLLFGSFLIPHARDFYSECLWTALSLVLLALLSALWNQPFQRGKFALLVLCLALLIPLNPVLSFVCAGILVCLLGLKLWQSFRMNSLAVVKRCFAPEILALLIGLCVGTLLCLLENVLRRGHVLNFGYGTEGFSTPWLYGLAGQLFSPSRGLVFFIPTFFCGCALLSGQLLKTREEFFLLLTLLYSALLVGIYSTWWAWHGGLYWGPRFLLPLSVFGILYWILVVKKIWRKSGRLVHGVLTALVFLSYSVYKAGVAVNHRYLGQCLAIDPASDACFWKIQFLPYVAWLNSADLMRMLTHRSTVVELAGIMLMALLTSFTTSREPYGV